MRDHPGGQEIGTPDRPLGGWQWASRQTRNERRDMKLRRRKADTLEAATQRLIDATAEMLAPIREDNAR